MIRGGRLGEDEKVKREESGGGKDFVRFLGE
jgi:hypothetical protein